MNSSLTLPTSSSDAASRLGLPDIAFSGKAGSGKTTASNFLVAELGYNKLSFAAPIKKFEGMIFKGPLQRERQIKLGRAIREIDDRALARYLISEAQHMLRPHVVDDVRFPAEAEALKGAGFVTINIVSHATVRIDRLRATGKMELLEHLDDESETALDAAMPDHYIYNHEAREDMIDRLLDIIIKERRRR